MDCLLSMQDRHRLHSCSPCLYPVPSPGIVCVSALPTQPSITAPVEGSGLSVKRGSGPIRYLIGEIEFGHGLLYKFRMGQPLPVLHDRNYCRLHLVEYPFSITLLHHHTLHHHTTLSPQRTYHKLAVIQYILYRFLLFFYLQSVIAISVNNK